MLRYIVDRLHVATSEFDVVREIARRAIRTGTFGKAERKDLYRKALAIHAENRQSYRAIATGRF